MLIRLVVTYVCETWAQTKKTEEMEAIFERKILRNTYGPVSEKKEWRIRYNHELYQLHWERNLVDYISSQRLRWVGHMERVNNERVPKTILKGQKVSTEVEEDSKLYGGVACKKTH